MSEPRRCEHEWVREHGSSAEFCCLCGIGPFEQGERPAVRQPASEPASEQVARMFHEAYERLAPEHSYETRRESAVPWEQVPENNRRLMIAVAEEVLAALAAARGDTP